jgi:hypothetical protein
MQQALARSPDETATQEDEMELRENRTELERLLADVWDYEDGAYKKTSLPKWLFALTFIGAVICTFSPSDIVVPVIKALAPAQEKLSVDYVVSENVAEDLDYRVARRTDSLAGWRAFLDAHPNGPHAQAARAAIDGAQPATPPQPEQSGAPAAEETAQQETAAPVAAVMEENEAAPPPQPLEVGEQSPPTSAATETPAPSATPVMLEEEEPPPQPAAVADRSPPPSAAKLVEAARSPAPGAAQSPAPAAAPVIAEEEPAPPPQPAAIAADPPLPPSRPREIEAAKSQEPAHNGHLRAEHRKASQPNVLTILVAQLLHRQSQRLNVMNGGH